MAKLLALVGLMMTLAAPAVRADMIVGLVGDRTIVTIDLPRGVVTALWELDGISGLYGFDRRPGAGTVVAITRDRRLIEIDPTAVSAEEIGPIKIGAMLVGQQVSVDFNPTDGKLRLLTEAADYRIDVDTGQVRLGLNSELSFDAGVRSAVAAAYAAVPEGVFAPLVVVPEQLLGTLGSADVQGQPFAFDIRAGEEGASIAWLSSGMSLHLISLETGNVEQTLVIDGLPGPLRDIAILPEG